MSLVLAMTHLVVGCSEKCLKGRTVLDPAFYLNARDEWCLKEHFEEHYEARKRVWCRRALLLPEEECEMLKTAPLNDHIPPTAHLLGTLPADIVERCVL